MRHPVARALESFEALPLIDWDLGEPQRAGERQL
jgi:hypothetical protein